MEIRKKHEIEHYDTRARAWLEKQRDEKKKVRCDFEGFQPITLASYQWCYNLLAQHARNKNVLDFGCGNGVHLAELARLAQNVIGVDLSKPSLEIARRRIASLGERDKITLLIMDCEHLEFKDNTFDVAFDSGTFSSLDFDTAIKELARILTPMGCVVGIETFGHNPFTNFKRFLNKTFGKRTSWAANHILTTAHLKQARNYFQEVNVYYFHLISWIAFPFLQKPGGVIFLRMLESVDKIFFLIPFLRKYAFKIVFIFSKPIK